MLTTRCSSGGITENCELLNLVRISWSESTLKKESWYSSKMGYLDCSDLTSSIDSRSRFGEFDTVLGICGSRLGNWGTRLDLIEFAWGFICFRGEIIVSRVWLRVKSSDSLAGLTFYEFWAVTATLLLDSCTILAKAVLQSSLVSLFELITCLSSQDCFSTLFY